MVRSARKLAMASMFGVLCQYAIHEKCTPKSFSERLLFNPATMPVCAHLGRFADSTWTQQTWDQLGNWVLALL